MTYKVFLKNIPLFKYMPQGAGEAFSPYFHVMRFAANSEVLKFNSSVAGLFFIVKGEVIVYGDDYKVELNRLKEGSAFGEMSLIDHQLSSANLKANEQGCVCILCRRKDFHLLLAKNKSYSVAFYRAAAELLSERLRKQNLRLSKEVEKIDYLLDKVNDKDNLFTHLNKAKEAVEGVGVNIFSKLKEVFPLVENLEKFNDEEISKIGQNIKSNISHVLKLDLQSFDVVAQQLSLIYQHVENLRRISQGQSLVELSGDKNIFSGDANKKEGKEIVFF